MADTQEGIKFFTVEWGEPEEVRYNKRDLMVYAVGIGCGQADPNTFNDLFIVTSSPTPTPTNQ